MLLRQNPHNVHEWQKRVKLFAADARKVVICYAEAVKTVDPKLAVGKLCNLWIEFARYVMCLTMHLAIACVVPA